MHGDGPVGIGDRVAAVLLAGGAGARFGAGVSKVYVRLDDRPVLAYALQVLEASSDIDDVVVVIRAEDRAAYDDVAGPLAVSKVRAVVEGGATRQDSEWAGLQAVDTHCLGVGVVLLHDAARPLVSEALIARLVTTSRRHACGALPARRLGPDLVQVSGAPRADEDLVAVETPQVFPLSVLLSVYRRAVHEGFDGVDTAETVQAHSDLPIRWVPAGAPNPKITHPQDLPAVEALLPAWRATRPQG